MIFDSVYGGRAEASPARRRAARPAHSLPLVRAIDLLEQAQSEREPDILWIAVDPRADSLRAQPRFAQVLARLWSPR